MPYRRCDDEAPPSVSAAIDSAVDPNDWRTALPTLTGSLVTLRELQLTDAPVLHALLATTDVSRFIAPLSTTVEVFERFVEWTHRRRAAGEHACFAVVPRNADRAVTKTMILEHIWDYSFDPQTNVVDVLVHRLRGKVDRDRTLIHTMRGVGYVLKAPKALDAHARFSAQSVVLAHFHR